MIRRLLLLNGLAIVGVVCAHATQWVYTAMFWWTDRYRPVSAPNYDQLGTPAYYAIVLLKTVCIFAVPAFLFATGFFVTYAARGNASLRWKTVTMRLRNLLIPYLIWTAVIFAGDLLQGITYTPAEYLRRLVVGDAVPAFFYIILLCQLYLLSPLLVPLARTRGRQLLFASALVLLSVIGLFYFKFFLTIAGAETPLVDRLIELLPNQSFIRFIFFFVLGLVSGFHLQSLKQWLARFKRGLLVAVVVLAPLAALETELMFRLTGMDWRGGVFTITGSLYAITFVLCFLAFNEISIPFSRLAQELGRASFGIYLLHTTALEFFARTAQKFTPWILAHPVLLLLLLTILATGGPWLLMKLVHRSPVRRSYRYLFG